MVVVSSGVCVCFTVVLINGTVVVLGGVLRMGYGCGSVWFSIRRRRLSQRTPLPLRIAARHPLLPSCSSPNPLPSPRLNVSS